MFSCLFEQPVGVPLGIIVATGVGNGNELLESRDVGLPEVAFNEGVYGIFVKTHSIIQPKISFNLGQDQPLLAFQENSISDYWKREKGSLLDSLGVGDQHAGDNQQQFSIISSPQTRFQMHRPHTSSDYNHFLSPATARHRPPLSPRDGQNRKKDRQRDQDAGNYYPRQKTGSQRGNNNEQAVRSSNGSLRKHQYSGRIPYSPAHHETPPNRNASRSKLPCQQIDSLSRQRHEPQVSSSRGHVQWGVGVQGREGNSQYYHSQKIGKARGRQEGYQRKRREMEGVGLCKIEEVTFSMDSTQPETEDKSHQNQYQLVDRKTKNGFSEGGGGTSNGQFVTAFRKKIIQKEIAQKQKLYRSYIRSSSRESNAYEKVRLKSKMKQVLDDLYQLKKLIKN